ncbi:MAG: imidazole glycerol phosphate synthase subunit HisH [Anaerolineae bacterium]|nr:imidazole glycerol phosphate synthase subunit HisH [Anaerolineae bacterium]MDW8071540.1 imidazole glycerol phosphate synthase subunit HisH [Anaerolineae bacterium]
MQLAIVDAGIGNLRSVQKAFEFLGVTPSITHDPDVVLSADALVLPGVGAFGDGMQGLRQNGLDAALHQFIESGRPFLGICVGLQLLFAESEEMGWHRGLGVLPGRVVRFPHALTVPHMGWNQLHRRQDHFLLKGVPDGAFVYFAHSYHAVPDDQTIVIATTDYGGHFPSVVARDNIWAVQFHPEKSGRIGLSILRNFLEHISDHLSGH